MAVEDDRAASSVEGAEESKWRFYAHGQQCHLNRGVRYVRNSAVLEVVLLDADVPSYFLEGGPFAGFTNQGALPEALGKERLLNKLRTLGLLLLIILG